MRGSLDTRHSISQACNRVGPADECIAFDADNEVPSDLRGRGSRWLRRFGLIDRGPGLVVACLGLALAGLLRIAEAASGAAHPVPPGKGVADRWAPALSARGEKDVFRGADLRYLGMPVGGMGTGQLYLCGDGTLGCWEIFNRHEYLGTGELNYAPRVPAKPVDQGFAVVIDNGRSPRVRCLNAREFTHVEFCGTYPTAKVRYTDAGFPLEVELEAFSPFVPLDAKESALPATVFTIRVRNASDAILRVRTLGWLENAVCLDSSADVSGAWHTQRASRPGRALLIHGAEEFAAPARTIPLRPVIVLQDFEGADYGTWRTTGEAFGAGPTTGGLEARQSVTGFQGKGLASSFRKQDLTIGTLVSPPFTIERRYLNFLIGGGHFPASPAGVEVVRLKIGGEVVRSATGENDERLRWETWDVAGYEGREGAIELVDSRPYPGGHILVDQIELSDEKRRKPAWPFGRMRDYGTLAFAFHGAGDESDLADLTPLLRAPVNRTFQSAPGAYAFPDRRNAALASAAVELAAGASRTFTWVLAWHFPNAAQGREYATRFADARVVAEYILDHLERLAGDTRRWRDTYYDSTLPFWLLDRLHSTISTLATGTCQWWANGRFWAWEGVVSCPGTCTHVWNYAQGEARLFPELARSVREMQDLSAESGAFHPDTGLVGFRSDDRYAADGQCGTVLKVYREHLTSPDDGFLRRNWPKARQVLEYCIQQDGPGGSVADGLIENSQPNTYDIAFEGANTFVGSLYLAALRAGEEMAREMGEAADADRLRQLFERGRRLSVERLWNGEYFVQAVDLAKHPANQYGPGCLSDQLFGQSWAHQTGLGHLYPEAQVKRAIESVWKYNWAPDVGPYLAVHPALRSFAQPGEAGLFLVTWPNSAYLERSMAYRSEVWTGVEYQVAANLIGEGFVEQGLAVCRGIHERYSPAKRNPYNEVECGDHYARGLASWGVLTALCGFEYHGPNGHIGFAPRLSPENFKAAFTAAEGWGAFTQQQAGNVQRERIEVQWGRLALNTLAFAAPGEGALSSVTVQVGNRPLRATHEVSGRRLLVVLDRPLILKAGDTLEVHIGN